ncbi:MAG: 6-carboxytetrahydropterin synthase [Bacteroidales bacterium]|nr:MAG: 6-carboxytetrahydropterin synthase [Bacteroidales bacterium]
MAYITRRERFNAAHRLYSNDLTDEENLKVYGKCTHPNWHGHNFELFVTVKGEIDKKIGYVTNLTNISKLIKELVIDKIDHRNINLDVDFMQGKIASTENLAVAIWAELEKPIKDIGVMLHCVKIQETENNYVEYFGE